MTTTQTPIIMMPTQYVPITRYVEERRKTPGNEKFSDRTVKRWLAGGQLPDAYQDERGRWMIPIDAEPVKEERPDVVTLMRPRTSSQDVPSQELAPVTVTAGDMNTLPSFLTLDQASQLLGVSKYAIATHQDYFDVVPFGENGRLVVPLSTLKRIRGM